MGPHLHRLPDAPLRRAVGADGRAAPRPGLEVVVRTAPDGATVVSAAETSKGRGAGFVRVYADDPAQAQGLPFASASYRFTPPALVLSAGFRMVEGSELFCIDDASSRRARPVGRHYALVPTVDMPLAAYAAEVERLLLLDAPQTPPDQPSRRSGGIPADWPGPSDCFMNWICLALRELGDDEEEPPSVRASVRAFEATIRATDLSFDEMLAETDRADMAAWALAAMERYYPPEEDEDPADASVCCHVEFLLRAHIAACPPPP